MPYYHDLVTEQSWAELQALRKQIPFLLIGGWATYLYTQALKSKDIDGLLKTHDLLPAKQTFLDLLREYREVPELNLNAHHLSRLKKEVLAALA